MISASWPGNRHWDRASSLHPRSAGDGMNAAELRIRYAMRIYSACLAIVDCRGVDGRPGSLLMVGLVRIVSLMSRRAVVIISVSSSPAVSWYCAEAPCTRTEFWAGELGSY